MAAVPPRYPKATLDVREGAINRGGFHHPKDRWEVTVESDGGKFVVRDSTRHSTVIAEDKRTRSETGKDVPELSPTRTVWYLYHQEDALRGSWPIEKKLVPVEIHTITYATDMASCLAHIPAEKWRLTDLLLAAPPPRFPVMGNISYGQPRHSGDYFVPDLQNGRFVNEEIGAFSSNRPVSYAWKNLASQLQAAKSKPNENPAGEWLKAWVKHDLAHRESFKPHLAAISKLGFRASETTSNVAATAIAQEAEVNVLAGDPKELASHAKLTAMEATSETGTKYRAYLDFNGKLVLFLALAK